MLETRSKPRFDHDCSGCMYLGNYKEFDVYYCRDSGAGSIILRFGDEAPEYASSPVSCAFYTDPELSETSYVMHKVAIDLLRCGYVKLHVNEEHIEKEKYFWGDFWTMRKGDNDEQG